MSRATVNQFGLRISVAQLGARRHYAIPVILWRKGWLDRLYTDLCSASPVARLVNRVLPLSLQRGGIRRLLGRQVPEIPADRITSFPGLVIRQLFRRRKESTDDRYSRYTRDNERFGKLVVRSGILDANAVYVFNGAGLEILRAARERGMRTVVEQTSACLSFEESLLAEERQRWAEWEVDGTPNHSWKCLAERERLERELADVIVCGSKYVVDSLEASGAPVEKCELIPYAAPGGLTFRQRSSIRNRPLRVLFAGSICLRKGVPYLMKAATDVDPNYFEFRVVGPCIVSDKARRQLEAHMNLIGTVPREMMREQFDWADVFVLPTISEGSANVCYEALASGLPIITTLNAGSVVRDEIEGFLVPIRDSSAIAHRLERLLREPKLLTELSRNAGRRAAEFTWDSYESRLVQMLQRRFQAE